MKLNCRGSVFAHRLNTNKHTNFSVNIIRIRIRQILAISIKILYVYACMYMNVKKERQKKLHYKLLDIYVFGA